MGGSELLDLLEREAICIELTMIKIVSQRKKSERRIAYTPAMIGRFVVSVFALAAALSAPAADLPGSKDPPGMKRYEGSEIIGYRAPKFEEFVLPLGPPTTYGPVVYAKTMKVEGLVSRYTYIAPAGRTPAELFRNY